MLLILALITILIIITAAIFTPKIINHQKEIRRQRFLKIILCLLMIANHKLI